MASDEGHGGGVAPTQLAVGNSDPMLGQVLDGRYKILSKLGEGGMGEVYAAEHVHIEKRVAVKLLRAEIVTNQEAVQRFRQEARSASSIGHANIVAIEDFGQLPDGRIYMCMEFLSGQPLNDLLKQQALEPGRALDILIQTCHGLAAAHAKNIVHRDMKPENIFVTVTPDGREVPKLLDFGIAKVSGNDGNNHLTRTGTIFGTPFYMAPEQALGQAVDHRADVYALGVIMYEVFGGTVPFKAESFMAILTQHITTEPAPVEQVAAQNGRVVPPAVAEIIRVCMRKEPTQRYPTMDSLTRALVEARQHVVGPGMSSYFEAHRAPASSAYSVPQPTPQPTPMPTPMPMPSGYVTQQPQQPHAYSGHYDYAPPHAGKKGKGGIIAALLVVLLAAGGGAGYYVWQQGQADDETAETKDDPPPKKDDPPPQDPPPQDPPPDEPVGTVVDVGKDDPPDEPVVEAPKPVTVLVNSKPQGAKVFEGDKELGKTPLNIKVTPGEPRELRFERRKYDPHTMVVDGAETKITATLSKEGRGGSGSGGSGNTGNTGTGTGNTGTGDTGTGNTGTGDTGHNGNDGDDGTLEDGLIDDDSDILE